MCARDGPGGDYWFPVGPPGPAEMCPGNGSARMNADGILLPALPPN